MSATRSRTSFAARVRAEELPTRWHWQTRDTIAALAVPAMFAAGGVTLLATNDVGIRVAADTTLRIAIFAVLVGANASMLARHWRAFRRATWRSVALVMVGVVLIQVIATALGIVLRRLSGPVPDSTAGDASTLAFGLLLFASLGPMVTALIEDFAFRHTLLLKLPVWSAPALAGLVIVANALLFGAIHLHNFGGVWLLTLTFAGVGLFMNLVYLWTRNIWHVLLMHAVNNFVLAGPVTLVLVKLLEDAVA